MNLNQVTYGNPTLEEKEVINKPSILDDLFAVFKEDHFPLSDSELVKEELNEIVEDLTTIAKEENETYLKRFKSYDRGLIQVITTTFKQRGIDVEELCKEISFDLTSLLYKLKYHYQRPRPNQLAQYYKLKLFPYESHSANTPSYPSGHTLQAFVILNVIANKYPKECDFCDQMIEDISNSRLYLGLHYPSDNDFAVLVGNEVLKHKEFTKKYKI